MTTCLSDESARAAIDNSRNMLVPWYLMAAYAYYVLDTPILTDGLFDDICKRLDAEWDEIEHMHKWWIDREDLSAGTRLSTLYPSMAKGGACHLAGFRYEPKIGLLAAMEVCEEEMRRLTGVLPCMIR